MCFAVISVFWISCADMVINILVSDTDFRLQADIFIGLSYVVVMAAILYILLRRYARMIQIHEQNYQIMADSGPILIWTSGTDRLCNYFNRTWLEFTGRSLEQELGNGWADGVHPDDLQRCLDIYVGSFDRREKFSMEYRLRRHDGEYRWLLDDGCPRYDTGGIFMGYIGYCLDISDAKIIEEHLRQSQKMESIGTLAGGVAHDFNNILTVIIGACKLLEMQTVDNPECLQFVNQISNSADRAARLTENLLTFSRKQPISKKRENITLVVQKMQEFLERIIGEDVLLTTNLPEAPMMVMIDRGQIEQVLMNLVANARDAMPHGGVLEIGLSRCQSDSAMLKSEWYRSGGYVLITVKDSGDGIDTATQQRIFEPFFTTKHVGKGTGLGLSVAYGIIRQHDGWVDVSSNPGDGTMFTIYLPLPECDSLMRSARTLPHLPGGNETILLVEDDPNVLLISKRLLETAGYLVLCASDGIEALELFKRGSDIISLVVLDVIMAGMNGKQVHEKLKAHKQDVKVLYASGYAADVLNKKGVIVDSVNFISKPLDAAVFLGRVRKLIDA